MSYAHLSQAMPILAVWVADVPKQMFEIFNRVAYEVRWSPYSYTRF